MKLKKNQWLIAAVLLLAFMTACKGKPQADTAGALPRSTPEAEGVSSAGILAFLDSASTGKHEFHSIMILRHGKVIAEGWWKPYKADLKHTMYSTSKSFTSTAVGFAVTEKLLSVNDKVISYFPDELPDTVSPFLSELTIKDLLTMSVGQDPDPTFSVTADSNWIRSFLALPVLNKPGTKFLYNSMATYMLSAIVQKVTGQKVLDYLTPRLFEPLGISGIDWDTDPKGINTGGWGLRLKTEDMAKFGQLYLQKGKWYDQQILPASWIEEATTFKIDQAPDAAQSKKDSSDWMQGYCYQFWRCRHNAFRGDGAYGQYIIVLPEKDAVIAITSESPDMQGQLNMVWDYLLPAMKDEPLSENAALTDSLNKRLASLTLPVPSASLNTGLSSSLSGKTFAFENNPVMLDSVSFLFAGDTCRMTLYINQVSHVFDLGAGELLYGETTQPGPSLIRSGSGLPSAKTAGCYTMKGNDTIEMMIRYIESPHHYTLTGTLDKNQLIFSLAQSQAFGKGKVVLKGKLKK